MRAPAEPFVGDLGEPALDEIHPARGGGREVELEAGMAQKPALDGGGLVGGGVV